MQETPAFYSGISGIALPVTRVQYPPDFQDKSRLQYYASLFNSVEVNSIFYKLPRKATLINWSESVPPNFKFTFKVSKTVTHCKDLAFKKEDIAAFVDTIGGAGEKTGCLLVQFPPSLKVDKLNELQTLVEALGEATADKWNIAMEFRNASWYEREVYELLNEYNITLVIQDIPVSATPINDLIGSFIYLRFHGPDPRYRGDYSDEFLKQKAQLIKDWLKEGKTVYAYFNNTMGNAVSNLQTLNEYVNS